MRRSRACVYAVCALVTLASLIGASDERDIEAVTQFWITQHRNPPLEAWIGDEKRHVAPLDQGLFPGRLARHRLYTFPENNWRGGRCAVVAVDDSGGVTHLGSPKGLTSILEAEGVPVDSASKASEVARAYLLFRHCSFFFECTCTSVTPSNHDMVVSNISEIPTTEDAVKLDLPNHTIHAPQVRETEHGFEYSMFLWSLNNGSLRRVAVDLGSAGVLHYRAEEVATGLGDYGHY